MTVVTVGLVVILVWPGDKYVWSRVDALVRDTPRPYRSVSVEYFLDGGSIGIFIIDAAGSELNLILPAAYQEGRRCYERLAQPIQKYSMKGMREIPFSVDTRNYLIGVIEQHRGANGEGHLALVYLRGWAEDYLHFAGLIARIQIQRLGDSILRGFR